MSVVQFTNHERGCSKPWPIWRNFGKWRGWVCPDCGRSWAYRSEVSA